MTLLDELEKITDFEHVDRLLTDEYLMRHVTPTLTKLLARVARVRPKNAVEFLVSHSRQCRCGRIARHLLFGFERFCATYKKVRVLLTMPGEKTVRT